MSPVARSIVISFGEYPPMLTNGVTETGYAGAAAAAARSAARIAHWKLMLFPPRQITRSATPNVVRHVDAAVRAAGLYVGSGSASSARQATLPPLGHLEMSRRSIRNAALRPAAHYLLEGPKEDAMGILDRIFGQQQPPPPGDAQPAPQELSDEQALQRYRYLVRTAPPEAIEEAHREAFARLKPEQHAQLLRELNAAAPANERISDPSRNDPQTLARMATRAELRQPGFLEQRLGGTALGSPGLGGMFASSLLGSVVGSVIGSAIAHQFLGGFHDHGVAGDEAASDASAGDDADVAEADSGDSGDDLGGGLG